jgi:hypothetical protein
MLFHGHYPGYYLFIVSREITKSCGLQLLILKRIEEIENRQFVQ